MAIFDFDGDGRQDIFFTNGAKLPELKKVDSSFHSCLLRNLGRDRFGDVTEQAGLTGVGLGSGVWARTKPTLGPFGSGWGPDSAVPEETP